MGAMEIKKSIKNEKQRLINLAELQKSNRKKDKKHYDICVRECRNRIDFLESRLAEIESQNQ